MKLCIRELLKRLLFCERKLVHFSLFLLCEAIGEGKKKGGPIVLINKHQTLKIIQNNDLFFFLF